MSMLNISNNTVHTGNDFEGLESTRKVAMPFWHLRFSHLILILLGTMLVFLFLPWTQNIRAEGKVNTLLPEQRPQTIHATIPGRIEKWYVREGDFVKKGDTIVHLSEVKSEYFDPELVARVGQQRDAKMGSIDAYGGKIGALEQQVAAMYRERENKLAQIKNKIRQAELKVQSDSIKVEQARIDLQIAQRQYNRTDSLYRKGLKALTDFEDKRLKLQDTQTKIVAAQNAYQSSLQDLTIYNTDLQLTQNEYNNKISKTESDKFSTLSDQFDARASVSKLNIERENYSRRNAFYYILAPQDAYVVSALKPGIGEILKEGEPLVSIQPANYQLAVDLYIQPMDMPLIQQGTEVRFIFDGWPAFYFSGWPGISTGSYAGKVVALDRNISSNGKFRALVAPDTSQEAWPQALFPGGGAKGIALLNTVPLWYELWRMLNGFPPDLYKTDGSAEKSEKSSDKASGKKTK